MTAQSWEVSVPGVLQVILRGCRDLSVLSNLEELRKPFMALNSTLVQGAYEVGGLSGSSEGVTLPGQVL